MASSLRWLTRKTARTRGDHAEERALDATSAPLIPYGNDPSGASITATTALRVSDAWACIRALADTAASLPLIPYRRTATGRERYSGRITDLLDRPAPGATQANLIGQLVAHLNLHGNAYIGKLRAGGDRAAPVEQLWPLAPDRMDVEIKNGEPVYTYTDDRGHQSRLTLADLVHVKAMTTDGLVGLSPVRQCRTALGLSSRLQEHAARFFTNGALPAGILKVDSQGGPAQLQEVRESWNARRRGVENAHGIAVIAGDTEFTPVAMPLEDLQFLAQRELSATEVARIFRVPPWMIGAKDGGSLTYANVQQQAEAFVKFSLQPWLVLIEQALTADRDLSPQGVYVEFLIDGLLRADAATRSEIYTRALAAETGWLTRAEVRRLENLDPTEDQ